jgi:hypothetical protein
MSLHLSRAARGICLLLLLAAAHVVRAQEADPPGRAAQLSATEGSVSLQPAGVPDWTAATLNRPLTTGDKLWSDQNSRAELDVGSAVMRLGSSTGFSFLNLDDNTVQMQLPTGALIVRVRDMQAGQIYEVDTPNVAVSLLQPGDYRVEVNGVGDSTVVKVQDGAAQAAGGGQTVSIGPQQVVAFNGMQTLTAQSWTLGAPDDFDAWSAAREQQVEDSASSDYVASDIPGTQELDNSGRWQDTPDYGYVWMPTAVVVGWVPYRFGHWVWISPWGWTWVDDARWGYAPFHYGRWVQWNNTWCWVPGPRRVRPVYAPALVAWVGGPPVGGSVAFGSNVGWFPLGPREVYVPAYRVSPTYVRNVNVTNTNINATYVSNVYQRTVTPTHYVNNRPAAVTAVPQNIFISAQRVGGHAVSLPPAILAGALVTETAPAIAPIRQSVLGPNEVRGVARPPGSLAQRPVLARTPPPRAAAPFERQLQAMQTNGGRPLPATEIAQLQPPTFNTPVRMVSAGGPVISASSLSRGASAARSQNAGRPAIRPPSAPSEPGVNFAERERSLQQNMFPAAPGARSPDTRPAGNTHAPDTYVAPPVYDPPPSAGGAEPWRSERAPAAQPPLPSAPQRAFSADDPTHSYARPPALPVFHPPVGPDTSPPAPENFSTEGGQHTNSPPSAPHAPVPTPSYPPPPPVHGQPPVYAPPPPVHGQPPVYAQPPPVPAQPAHPSNTKEPRDSAPHGDRDSRERVLR